MDTTLAARLFAAIAHETRLDIVLRLAQVGELAASDLGECTGLKPSALSFHLKDLRMAGLVESHRNGQRLLYSISYEAFTALAAFLPNGGVRGSTEPAPWELLTMTTDDRVYNVLFLCTGNSARSIMAECILNREGLGRFRAFSAGSRPRGEIDPIAKALLGRDNYPIGELRSKTWDEFTLPESPTMDFVFTVCDDAAGEVCPVWPGQPMTAHWGVPDPVTHQGDETEKVLFTADVFRMLLNRISIFCALPLRSLDKLALQRKLDRIGQTNDRARVDVA
ncbi:MAG: metalloregulator ArsR/SmtB family transcription factor [Rhodospirillum sp.]|nr:metalloregulator ArsR/SmtB family transcription factor [Rhodospirillum sp.]MCF8489693.1 metalloregulator ArsR/SmtB family transcription factor [Rhodospirillum sp.]MCF8501668.1 metalloregulator ArsR/SmtB family transcription factor [Rhodospirillum sp.]